MVGQSERKGYATRQREAVLACFEARPREGLTAQEVYQHLYHQGVQIGRTTVYRAIAHLVGSGALMALSDLGSDMDAPRRYQHKGQDAGHISVRCTGCGLITPLKCDAVSAFEQHVQQDHGFRLKEEECILPGLCAHCHDNSPMPQESGKESP